MSSINSQLNFYYIVIAILGIIFIGSICIIKYLETPNKEEKETKINLLFHKYQSFLFPLITLSSFFISCFVVSKIIIIGSKVGKAKYFGIYFLLFVTLALFILNNTILKEDNIIDYIKGKKFSIVGLIMISGASALIFGFIDNFGLSLGVEALDHTMLNIFIGPFSVDKRFIQNKKTIAKNLNSVNNWSNGKWRSIINHTLRFKEDIRKIKGTKDLMEDIDEFVNKQGAKPLDIPKNVVENNQTHAFIKNIKDKYDIIENSKALIGNTFSNFIGAILGAALLNLFTYMTKYDGIYTGDSKIDDNFFVSKLNSYHPLLEGIFIGIGCLIPVVLNIAMKRDDNNTTNQKAWIFITIIVLLTIVMMFLSVKGTKKMTKQDKKNSIRKTLLDMKKRLDISKDSQLNKSIDNFLQDIL
jgi:glycerol uptake facilitator-like aquaporin